MLLGSVAREEDAHIGNITLAGIDPFSVPDVRLH